MVKLEMELSDIDYDALAQEFLPRVADRLEQNGSPLASLVSGGMAGSLLKMMPESVKDKLAAEMINAAASRMEQSLEEFAAKNGIPGKVKNLRATASADE